VSHILGCASTVSIALATIFIINRILLLILVFPPSRPVLSPDFRALFEHLVIFHEHLPIIHCLQIFKDAHCDQSLQFESPHDQDLFGEPAHQDKVQEVGAHVEGRGPAEGVGGAREKDYVDQLVADGEEEDQLEKEEGELHLGHREGGRTGDPVEAEGEQEKEEDLH
jgi:hypothetical protein